jgi:coenzyme PQQ biosynthesis protein PqqD
MTQPLGRPRRNPQVLAQQGEKDLVLLYPQSGNYYTLDEVGSHVWSLCDGTHTVAAMAARIGEEFEAPVEEIEQDVRELLIDLADEHLVIEAG